MFIEEHNLKRTMTTVHHAERFFIYEDINKLLRIEWTFQMESLFCLENDIIGRLGKSTI